MDEPLLHLQTQPYALFINAYIHTLTKLCVPVFIMISGRFLIGRHEPLLVFYTKRVRRIAIPLITWSILYSLYTNSPFVVYELITGTAYYHVWYVYMLAGLYAITPFITYVLKLTNGTAITFGAMLLILGTLVHTVEIRSPYVLTFLLSGYYIMGYGLTKDYGRKIQPWLLVNIIVVTTTLNVFLLYISYVTPYTFYFNSYVSPFVIIGSVSLYVLIGKLHLSRNICSRLAPYTLGIYLVHSMVLEYLANNFSVFNTPSWINTGALVALTFVISLGIVAFLTRIPLLRRTV